MEMEDPFDGLLYGSIERRGTFRHNGFVVHALDAKLCKEQQISLVNYIAGNFFQTARTPIGCFEVT